MEGKVDSSTFKRGNMCTFLVGEVGVVTWLLGVVGDVTVILVGADAGVLLEMLDGTEDLVLSGKKKEVVNV